jgi:hypothetical protein
MWKLERGTRRGRIKAEPFGRDPYILPDYPMPGVPTYLGPDWGTEGPRVNLAALAILHDFTGDLDLAFRLAPYLAERVLRNISEDEYFLTDAVVAEALEEFLPVGWMEERQD